jgi:protein-L-isoaspartate(D-aspartate) O-methyltransferase
MVEVQLMARGISDKRLLEVMEKIPRHLFVPDNIKEYAYDDSALPIGEGQTISQPYMVTIMTELLELKGTEKVLEVGTGSGYQAAILSSLCKKVISVERIKPLADKSAKLLAELGYNNVEVVVGDGTEGYEPESPYDGIIVTAACPDIPDPLIRQLKEGGRLILPVGERYSQTLIIVRKEGGKIETEQSIGCVFVPLIGKYGFQQ